MLPLEVERLEGDVAALQDELEVALAEKAKAEKAALDKKECGTYGRHCSRFQKSVVAAGG